MLNGTYHEKSLFGELRHLSSENDLIPADGEITIKTPMNLIRSLKGSYQVKLENGVLDANIFLTRNDKDTVRIETNGLIYKDDITMDISIDHTFGTKEKIDISTVLKRNSTLIFNSIAIKSGVKQLISELKLKQYPYLKFDYKLEAKTPSPVNLRIAYTNNDKTKILKSELKYQNTQMAG